MDSFLIHGGQRLKGAVEISGSKNSALPILAACLMAEGPSRLNGVPRLSDIDSMNKLIGELGCRVRRHDPAGAGDVTALNRPLLNGPLDIEVLDEEPLRGEVRHRQNHARQHLRAGAAARQARQGGREPARRMRHRRPAGRSPRPRHAKTGRGIHNRKRKYRRQSPRQTARLPHVSRRGAGADRPGDDQRHVRRVARRRRNRHRRRGVRAGSLRLRGTAHQDGRADQRPRDGRDSHRGRRKIQSARNIASFPIASSAARS